MTITSTNLLERFQPPYACALTPFCCPAWAENGDAVWMPVCLHRNAFLYPLRYVGMAKIFWQNDVGSPWNNFPSTVSLHTERKYNGFKDPILKYFTIYICSLPSNITSNSLKYFLFTIKEICKLKFWRVVYRNARICCRNLGRF